MKLSRRALFLCAKFSCASCHTSSGIRGIDILERSHVMISAVRFLFEFKKVA